MALIAGVAMCARRARGRVERALSRRRRDRRASASGPAFAGVFRALSLRAPADQRAALLSAIFVVSYLAFSVPAIIAGAAVTQLGLRETAEIYGGALIAIAAVALALSGNLDGARGRRPRRRSGHRPPRRPATEPRRTLTRGVSWSG